VFLQLSRIALFGVKWTFLHLENYDFQYLFLSKQTPLSLSNNAVDTPTCNMDGIVLRDTCISSTLLNTSIWNKMRTFSFWKSGICSKYSFRKLTQFSQGINDLVPPACNTRGCLGEINVLFHLIWIGLLRAQWSYLHHEIPLLKEVFLEKLSQFPQGNNALDLPASNTDGCLWTDTCVSLTQLNRPIWYKMSLCPPWKLWFAEAFLSKTNSAHRETMFEMPLLLTQMVFFGEIHVFLQLT
jgi:hypothetical protein